MNVFEGVWLGLLLLYSAFAFGSFGWVVLAIRAPVTEMQERGDLAKAQHFSEANRERLQANFRRMGGTLGFWKNRAERWRRLHFYCIVWTLLAGILVPVLAQVALRHPHGGTLITFVSLHASIMFGVHRSLKVESNYQAYRLGESEFYDLYRRLLDRPHAFGETESRQIDEYMRLVESIRVAVRSAEVSNTPGLDATKSAISESMGQRTPPADPR